MLFLCLGLEYFTNVLLVSSVQDHYVPFHSSRIELPKSSKSNSQECMFTNIILRILHKLVVMQCTLVMEAI